MELKKKASELDAKIATEKEATQQLARRLDSIQPNTSLGEIETIIQAKKTHENKLQQLQLIRMAVEKKLNEYANNAPKAKPLVEDAGAAHERGREIFVKFAEHQEACRALQKDQDQVNLTLSTKAKEFEDLTGESMGLPLSMICYPAAAFAAAETIRPYDAWLYRSQTELKVEHNKELQMRLQAHEKRLKLAEEHAPNCVVCARSNVETRMVVDRRSGHSDAPGESLWHGQWHLVCPRCGTTQTVLIAETKTK